MDLMETSESKLFFPVPQAKIVMDVDVLGEIQRELTCPLCLGLYQTPTRVLPCAHTFCHECLQICMYKLPAFLTGS